MVLFSLKLHTPKTAVRDGLTAVDWFGIMTIVGSVVMFLLGLEFGGVTHPWNSAMVLCLIVFGLVTAAIFMMVEWKVARYPIIPLHMFKNRSNVASLLAAFCHGIVFIAAAFYIPLYFQAVLGASPLLSGVWFLGFALAISITAAATGIYIEKTGRYKELVILAFAFQILGFGLFEILPIDREWSRIIIFQIIAGIGSGPNFQAPLVALQAQVPLGDAATATATFNFVRNIATAIGVVLGSVILSNQLNTHRDELRQVLGVRKADLLTGGQASANVFIVDRLPDPQKAYAREVILQSLSKTWILFACLAAVGLIVSFFIRTTTLSQERHDVALGLEAEEEKRQATQMRRAAGKLARKGKKEDQGAEMAEA